MTWRLVIRHLPAGSHCVIAGAKHEILQEDDRYREQLWAAFAFMPGLGRVADVGR